MNYSDIKRQIYSYLGFKNVEESASTDAVISECLDELEGIKRFKYLHQAFEKLPEFLCKDPYISFIEGCSGVILSVMTLGVEVDRRIKYLSRTDMTKSVIMDACASALLERLSDEYEKTLGENLTYRFCPGYGGSDISDVKYIFKILKPERIGVTLNDSNYMLPSKSMAGIIGVGKKVEKKCGECVLLTHCAYRKEGKRCYGSEKK